MTKKEATKKFNIRKQEVINTHKACATKFTDLRNLNHPYCRDTSKYGQLEFLIQLTRFETRKETGFACFGYLTQTMSYEQALAAFNEIAKDWQRPGRRAWNSVNLIGIDEYGHFFSAKEY